MLRHHVPYMKDLHFQFRNPLKDSRCIAVPECVQILYGLARFQATNVGLKTEALVAQLIRVVLTLYQITHCLPMFLC